MSAVILDTDVASFFFKNHPQARAYEPEVVGRTLALSFMSVAELERWAIQSNWGAERRARLDQYLSRFVIIPFSRPLCTRWAEVTVEARRRGIRIECADAWIAATAIHYSLPLVTHNHDDYRGVLGITVVCRNHP